jgi:hypothetical protein
MRVKLLHIGLAAVLAAAAGTATAQTYRVSNSIYGYYQAYTEVTISGLGTFNRTDTMGSASDYAQEFSVANLPLTRQATNTWSDTYGYGMPTVTQSRYTSTDFRHNHASLRNDGFVSVVNDSTVTYCPNPGGGGVCVGPDVTVSTHQTNSFYGSANSRWEELYYIGGGSGTGTMTPSYHIDGTLGPSASGGDGYAAFQWLQSDFQGRTVLGIYGYYYNNGGVDSWFMGRWDPVAQAWNYSSGTGTVVINENITAQVPFTYGQPFYVDSNLQAWGSGDGTADVENTVTLTSLTLPEHASLFVASGTDYLGTVAFGGDGGGTLCPTQACTGGGDGGGGVPVPEPGTYALMLAGLGTLGLLARRRRAR